MTKVLDQSSAGLDNRLLGIPNAKRLSYGLKP